ncbi:capsule biosynthesis protein GfcC [Vibrio sp. ES.051]|uniref:capsule biosynthesis GfcC family protein n=1 Tax=Vibrio sp. ES.051 TaxID=1761909 RepID=UPI000BF57119|nr:capsule biosynthesis GfcC family protein [Vibrio sp. ES.051]PFG45489.1 capsule biosynthesis protein GfcC [Vibrio sp. ES.051]
MSRRLFPLLSLALVASMLTGPVVAKAEYNNAPPLSVALLGTDKALQFEQPARLDRVLKLAQDQQQVLQYSLAVTLFDDSEKAQQESTALKNFVLNQMIQHNLVAHPFYKFLKQSQFAPRVLSAIDIDQVRLDKFDNPLLTGQFTLSASPREEKVLYVGNVDQIYNVKNQAGIPLQQQVENLQNGEIGKLAYPPIVIYPDGNVIQPHHGNWLTTQYYLPPLTMVYIPFGDFEQSPMDQDIVKLLVQRKPTSSKN